MVDARMPEKWLSDRRLLRLTDAVYRAYVNGLLYAVSNRTDGRIEVEDLALIPKRVSRASAVALESAGLWATVDGGWMIVDFDATQTSRDELARLDDIRRKGNAKKQRQRLRQREREAEGEPAIDVPGDVSPGTSQARPGQAEKKKRNERPAPHCDRHPGGTSEPCGACGVARRLHDQWRPSVPDVVAPTYCPDHPGYPFPCHRCELETSAAA